MTAPTLTPAQYKCARLAATLLSRAEIARRLGLHRSSVETHLKHAYRRLGVRNRRELALALLACEVRKQPRPGTHGFRRGDPVRIVGGRFAGRDATWGKLANSLQALVRIGGGEIAVGRHFVERIERGPR